MDIGSETYVAKKRTILKTIMRSEKAEGYQEIEDDERFILDIWKIIFQANLSNTVSFLHFVSV